MIRFNFFFINRELNRMITITLSMVFMFLSNSASANDLPINDFPEDFQALYQYKTKKVELKFADQETYFIEVQANYNTVKLSDIKQIDILRKALRDYKIKDTMINKIVSDLKIGVENTAQCKGIASSCVVSPASYETLFDYYTNSFYLWVNPSYLQQELVFNEEYAPSEKQQYSLINHISSYVNTSDGFDNYNVNLYDDSLIGLKYGYIDNRITYNTSAQNSDFDLDRSQYNYEFNQYRFRVGYNATVDDFNSTDFLFNTNNSAELAIGFGTSHNLIRQATKATQKIFFFAPRAGVLKVYRENRIVLQKNISGGQGYITNADLPRGRYNVTIEVSVGDDVISRENHAIFNTAEDKLSVGGVDYHFTGGIYMEDNDFNNDSPEYDANQSVKNQGFGRGLISYRATERILIGAGLSGSSAGFSGMLGGKLYLPDNATLNIKGQLFEDNAYQAESYFTWQNFNLSYEQYDNGVNDIQKLNDLATYYYGAGSYDRYSVSYSNDLPFLNGYGYANYSYSKQQTGDDLQETKVNVIGGGLRFPFVIDSTLDFSFNYNIAEDGQEDDYFTSIVWTIPINQQLNARSTFSMNRDGVSQFSNALETNDLISSQDYYLSASVENNYTPQRPTDKTYTSGSLNGQIENDAFTGSAYVYGDTNHTNNTSLGFNSSQVVTSNGISFTRHRSDAYVRVQTENQIREGANSNSRGLLVLERNGKYANKETLYKDNEILPLTTYQDYRASIDVESTDLFNTGVKRTNGFTQPGSVLEMKTKVSRVVTFVSGFKDIFDRDIQNIKCTGDGCIDVIEMVEGVYKISVLEGMSFGLTSGHNQCFIPRSEGERDMNFGQNYCLPNLAAEASMSVTVNDKIKTLTYLGSYQGNENVTAINSILKTVHSKDIEIRKTKIANNIYVYAITEKGFVLSASLKSKISAMQQYANEIDQLKTKEYQLTRH